MLSKRLGSLSLSAIAEDGIEPMAVASLLAKLGTSDPVEPRLSMAALVAEFEISKFGRAQPRLDPSELIALNAKLLHATPFEAVADRLPPGASRAFWEAVRPNLERQRDVAWWWRVCTGEIEPAADDPAYLAEAATLLPSGPLGAGAWKEWTERVKAATGRKGRALYQPLRRALTGRDHGPEMQALLPLIGRERVLARLRREAG
jgi:glutamyl-tRNA synthetase